MRLHATHCKDGKIGLKIRRPLSAVGVQVPLRAPAHVMDREGAGGEGDRRNMRSLSSNINFGVDGVARLDKRLSSIDSGDITPGWLSPTGARDVVHL